MITAIDTNILVDVIGEFSAFYKESSSLLSQQLAKGSLIISPLVYSELLAVFIKQYGEEAVNIMDRFLADLGVQIFDFKRDDFVVAAKAWGKFARSAAITCPSCGTINTFSCKKCNRIIRWRTHIITDFLIGAHAQNQANVLLTRDRNHYKTYFKIKVLP